MNEPFSATVHDGIVRGTCVALINNNLLYAGPLLQCPDIAGITILLHEDDFEELQQEVDASCVVFEHDGPLH